MKEVLEERLKELGISRYELAKLVAEKRGKKRVTDVSTTVSNVIDDPENRRYKSLAEVVSLLDGEIIIRWKNVTERKIS